MNSLLVLSKTGLDSERLITVRTPMRFEFEMDPSNVAHEKRPGPKMSIAELALELFDLKK